MKKAFIYTILRVYPSCGCQTYYAAIFSLLIGLLIMPGLGSAQAPIEQIRVTATDANIRSGPGINHPVVITASMGTVLHVLDMEGNWYRVRLTPEYGTQEVVGFIHNSIVEVIEAVPVTRSMKNDIQEYNNQLRVTAGTATIRSGPGIDQTVLVTVSNGTFLTINGQEANWFEIQLDPKLGLKEDYGFIHNSSVEVLSQMIDETEITQTKNDIAELMDTEEKSMDSTTFEMFKYGVGFHTPGLSGMLDISEKLTLQAIFGFFWQPRTHSGRVLYKLQEEDSWHVYSYGSVSIMRYTQPTIFTVAHNTESTLVVGFGAGVKYNWWLSNPNRPPIAVNLEAGLRFGEYTNVDYSLTRALLGIGIHYMF